MTQKDRGSFARLMSIVKMVIHVVIWWTNYNTDTRFYGISFVFALQEIDNWNVDWDGVAWFYRLRLVHW